MFHFLKRKLRIYFISPLDKSLDNYRKTHAKTASQKSEIAKHAKVFKQRDATS